jgi:hypothetical protein
LNSCSIPSLGAIRGKFSPVRKTLANCHNFLVARQNSINKFVENIILVAAMQRLRFFDLGWPNRNENGWPRLF